MQVRGQDLAGARGAAMARARMAAATRCAPQFAFARNADARRMAARTLLILVRGCLRAAWRASSAGIVLLRSQRGRMFAPVPGMRLEVDVAKSYD